MHVLCSEVSIKPKLRVPTEFWNGSKSYLTISKPFFLTPTKGHEVCCSLHRFKNELKEFLEEEGQST